MKVSISKESRRFISLAEAPIAQRIVKDLKEDESSAAEYATLAINAACEGHCVKVFEAKAVIAKNCRAYGAYFDDSGNLDVWVEATAQTSYGFCIIGAYLSDIWNLDGDNNDEMAGRMYIRQFKEVAIN